MTKTRSILSAGLALLFLAACTTPKPTVPATSFPSPSPEPDPVVSAEPAETTAPLETEAPAEASPAAHEWPAPVAVIEGFTSESVSAAEAATYDLLAATNFAANDPIALAIAIQGKPQPEPPPDEPPVLIEGATELFWIHNTDTDEWSQVEARLERISAHAYFWFDTTRELNDPASIDRAAEGFETYYQLVRDIYGNEPSPGIDGDPRIYVVHPSALALCNVTESTAHQCGLLGYFSTTDVKPVEIDEHSNEHEMFILNIDKAIGGEVYLSTLVHEFRHMIEHNYDRHDDDWEVEGTATVSQLISGDTSGPRFRADAYVENTDLQLNAWTQGNSNPHYGKGYVYSRYLLDRFGLDFYSAWVQHPDRAFFAIDAVLDQFAYDFSALDVWQEFQAAVALIGIPGAPPPFSFSADFASASPATTPINKFPSVAADTVSQFGFDIYRIYASTPVELIFRGTTKVPVLEGVAPASGEHFWWSGRANQSDMSLTRLVDLTGVSSATLEYSVYYSLEKGFDFAYVLVSTDGGITWQALTTENMQGEDPADNLGGFALTERFYTGRGREWIQEQVDLSAYAGQEILLRFHYITDAIFTAPGLALDNIAIPEIGFFDDAESLAAGWTTSGFLRVNAHVPQEFQVTLVTFGADGTPVVEKIPIGEDNTAVFTASISVERAEGYLIVGAVNPLLLTPAAYEIEATQ